MINSNRGIKADMSTAVETVVKKRQPCTRLSFFNSVCTAVRTTALCMASDYQPLVMVCEKFVCIYYRG